MTSSENCCKTMSVDGEFESHFRNLKQVFIYITDECNLRCKQCLYKANLILARKIDISIALRLITTFRKMGAFKLSILGGEPTLYDRENDCRNLFELIAHAKQIGYSYIRLDTNGQFDSHLLQHPTFKLLDEISFSIDGFNSQTHGVLRGEGRFSSAVDTLRYAVDLGFNTHITTCVTKPNSEVVGSPATLMDGVIRFFQTEGVSTVNFHGVFRMGTPMDVWTDNTHLTPDKWVESYRIINKKILAEEYSIPVRLPIHIITRNDFNKYPAYYGYCPAKLGERVLIHPNGIIRMCSSLLCTPYGVGRYDSKHIYWETISNELYRHDLNKFTPCTNQVALYDRTMVPVCFSLKPRQTEPVWHSFVEANKEIMP